MNEGLSQSGDQYIETGEQQTALACAWLDKAIAACGDRADLSNAEDPWYNLQVTLGVLVSGCIEVGPFAGNVDEGLKTKFGSKLLSKLTELEGQLAADPENAGTVFDQQLEWAMETARGTDTGTLLGRFVGGSEASDTVDQIVSDDENSAQETLPVYNAADVERVQAEAAEALDWFTREVLLNHDLPHTE